ncbi:hypothetical protein SEUCBS140593_010484 [Sporothrix eucalyptigena]|uniref:Uncharacterized protein n=1 Tax=Sporothrix eucalyptigena TaxID=1812306 RepID=A0ABP0D1H7_9PEZI
MSASSGIFDQPAAAAASSSRTSSPSRFPSVTSYAAAAIGAAAATFRLFGRLSDSTLPKASKENKGKGVASGYDSDSSLESIDLIRGMRRSRRDDYDGGDGSGTGVTVVDGLAAYGLPMPVVSAYCKL